MIVILEGKIKFLNSWFEKFYYDDKLKVIRMYIDKSCGNQIGIDIAMLVLHACIASCDLYNIYNMDEMSLFYSMAPNQTIVQQQIIDYKK